MGTEAGLMYRRTTLPPQLATLVDQQDGVIAVSQLLKGGLTRKVVRRMTSEWVRLSEGLYLTHTPTWKSAARAGLLRAGELGVLSGSAGAYLHGAIRDAPADVTLWSPCARSNFMVGPYPVLFRRGQRSGTGTFRRATVEQCVLDLASISDEPTVTSALSRALARHLTTAERMREALGGRRRLRHSAHIRALCHHSAVGIESALEWLFHRDVLLAHGLPLPDRQVKTGGGRVDGIYSDYRTIVELDGIRDHQDWYRDMMRDNRHAVELGALTLRYGWLSTSHQPCESAHQVGAAIGPRGWHGTVGRCPRCGTGPKGALRVTT